MYSHGTVDDDDNAQDDLIHSGQQQQQQGQGGGADKDLMIPLMASSSPHSGTPLSGASTSAAAMSTLNITRNRSSSSDGGQSLFRSRKKKPLKDLRRKRLSRAAAQLAKNKRPCCSSNSQQSSMVRSTLSAMNLLARILFWSSVLAMAAAVVWYSYELTNNGTDPHLIAWFSAGAFVLLGFPISMYGIVMHLANYNQPNVQCYIVRILWMVPLYSMGSWLCLRFHRYAIYIETLRDCYESYVLYSFLQFLIEVLGGEEELILMLKDKSPTRGVHMWGLQWCVKPWLMGQPVSRTVCTSPMARQVKKIQWTSPFFVKAKVGVLQYVLLKFVSSIFVMILELKDWYKEGDFTPKGGYLYICILTNLSQCWALYCLIFFYYATHNELGPIRPVGKFLSVKALVFFTWWQSVGISMLYQMDMIPHYHASTESNEWTSEDVAKGLQDYLICIEMFIGAIVHTFVFPHTDYLAPAVAARSQSRMPQHKRLGRKVYGKELLYYNHPTRDDRSSSSKNSASCDFDLELASHDNGQHAHLEPPILRRMEVETTNLSTATNTSTAASLHELSPLPHPIMTPDMIPSPRGNHETLQIQEVEDEDDDDDDEEDQNDVNSVATRESEQGDDYSARDDTEEEDSPIPVKKTGFVRALLDSSIPRDVMNNTVGMVKGDYVVEKKTLLHHATTSDQYDLFSTARHFRHNSTTTEKSGQS